MKPQVKPSKNKNDDDKDDDSTNNRETEEKTTKMLIELFFVCLFWKIKQWEKP